MSDMRIEEMLAVYDEQAAALRRTALGLHEMRLGSLEDKSNPVEIILSDAALLTRYQAAFQQVRHGMRSLVRPPYVVPPGQDVVNQEVAALNAGIHFQAIMGPELLDDHGMLAATMEVIKAGEETRILPTVPIKMMIFDSVGAVIAVPEHGAHVHLFVRESPLLDGMIAIFNALWRVATPLPRSVDPAARGNERVAVDRTVLTLLAAGATDAAIARHLDVSLRTAQRRISDIMSALGVDTRFQAGIQAARRGWL